MYREMFSLSNRVCTTDWSWKSTLTYAVSCLPVSLFLGWLVVDFGNSIRMRRPNRASSILKLYILLYISDISAALTILPVVVSLRVATNLKL